VRYRSLILVVAIAGGLTATSAVAKDHDTIWPKLPSAVTDADFRSHSLEKIKLGRLLMFDKILSGNKNISCATCHHALTDTGDGLSLSVGEGGVGLGKSRNTGPIETRIPERVPRNAPPVFNLGAHEFEVLFHDGRVQVDPEYPSGCKTPAADDLPDNLENVLACQAMFPVTSSTEMAGQATKNPVAKAKNPVAKAKKPVAKAKNPVAKAAEAGDLVLVWELLAERLQEIPEYVTLFKGAFDDIDDETDITYAQAANAMAAFEGTNWRADNSPFDRYLRGDNRAMSKQAEIGMKLFYEGDENDQACADCHSGKFQTDHDFHAIAMPQIGPGRGSDSPGRTGGHEDFGREQVTGYPEDILKFRTPTLRNVALTAPYGHAGAYDTLRAVVQHHMDVVHAIHNYDQNQAVLPPDPVLSPLDFITMDDPERRQFIADHVDDELQPFTYTDDEVDLIIEFLHALTDPSSIDLRSDQPLTVPSGLPLAD
jgi:cytochrome c peroxidase